VSQHSDEQPEEAARVRIWRDSDDEYSGEPDEVVEVPVGGNVLWQDDPHYHSPPLGLDVHPDDRPVTLNVYTSDSVRSPPIYDNHVDGGYWSRPMEGGLSFLERPSHMPFGCEIWGRVLFEVNVRLVGDG